MLILLSFSLCSSLQERLKHFCFLIFMVVLFTSGMIVHLFLPETKGKSIMEITEEFDKLNFKNKRVPETPNHVTEDYAFCTRLWLAARGNQFFEKCRKKKDICHFLTIKLLQMDCQLPYLSLTRFPFCQTSFFLKHSTLGSSEKG